MAHNYNLISVTQQGDAITIIATVDGTPVNFQVWASHLATLGTAAAKKAYLATQALAALPAVPVDLTATLGGSFSQ